MPSPDELGTDGLLRLLPLIVRLQLKDVPVDELLSVWPEGELQRQRFLTRDLGCQTVCRDRRCQTARLARETAILINAHPRARK